MLLFEDDVLIYIENPVDSTDKPKHIQIHHMCFNLKNM